MTSQELLRLLAVVRKEVADQVERALPRLLQEASTRIQASREQIQSALREALAAIPTKADVEALLERMTEGDDSVRQAIIEAMADVQKRSDIEGLLDMRLRALPPPIGEREVLAIVDARHGESAAALVEQLQRASPVAAPGPETIGPLVLDHLGRLVVEVKLIDHTAQPRVTVRRDGDRIVITFYLPIWRGWGPWAGAGFVAGGQDALTAAIKAAVWPVGSVFIGTTSANPTVLLGFGTWVALGTGRTLVGFDAADPDFNASKKLAGAKTVAAAGSNSAPAFTGSALSGHTHGPGSLLPSAHAGAAVADHASHTHQVDPPNTTTSVNSANTPALGVLPLGTVASAPHTHDVNIAAFASGGPSATLVHSVTQPNDHTMSGSSESVSAGTPAGTVSAPAFTGSPTSVVQPSIVVFFWERTA